MLTVVSAKCSIFFPSRRLLTIAFALSVATAADAQLPPQPPPVNLPMDQANEQERAACRPDVKQFCQTQLEANPNDVLGILGCLQTNRANVSPASQKVLNSHGQ
jgi:hypothetical protein